MWADIFDEYRRLIDEACRAVGEARKASDRGDVVEYRRLLALSVRVGKQAMNLMKDRKNGIVDQPPNHSEATSRKT